jgi:hypothetical protein
MVVELTPEAKEFIMKKKDTDAVTVNMIMSGG